MTIPLPRVMVLTDEAMARRAGHELRDVIGAVVDAGVRAVVVRERHLPEAERRDLVAWIAVALGPVDGLTIVADPLTGPHHGVHLRSDMPVPEPRPQFVGRSCHSTVEVAAAAIDGCDYVTLSPIFPTDSKPGYGPPLGSDALSGHPLPVFALGGIGPDNTGEAIAAGAHGVAVMGAIMSAAEPAMVAQALVEAAADASEVVG